MSTRIGIASALLSLVCAAGCGKQPAAAQNGAIAMSVTESGFDPDRISVKKGQPVKLIVTRKTDATCAKAIVIDEYHVHAELPLNTPVTVAFTPDKTGQIKYGCAMDKMVSGVMVVN